MKNIAYAGALAALLDIDIEIIRALLDGEVLAASRRCWTRTGKAIDARLRLRARRTSTVRCRSSSRRWTRRRTTILIDGNTAAALGCVYAGATVGAWYPITPATSLMEAFKSFCQKYRRDPETKKNRFAILQAEDELAAVGMVIGAVVGGRARVHVDGRPRHLADERVHRPRLLRRDPGGHLRRAAHRAVDRHADAHAAGRPDAVRLRLARRHAAHLPLSGRSARGVRVRGRRRSTSPSGSRRRCSC